MVLYVSKLIDVFEVEWQNYEDLQQDSHSK